MDDQFYTSVPMVAFYVTSPPLFTEKHCTFGRSNSIAELSDLGQEITKVLIETFGITRQHSVKLEIVGVYEEGFQLYKATVSVVDVANCGKQLETVMAQIDELIKK